MTFDEWWGQFLEIYGKPKDPAQLKLSRALAITAWTEGYNEGRKLSIKTFRTLKPDTDEEG